MWRKALTPFEKFRRRTDVGRPRTTGVIPIGIVVALAIVCVVAAVLTAAGRADDVELQQERLLLTNAISALVAFYAMRTANLLADPRAPKTAVERKLEMFARRAA